MKKKFIFSSLILLLMLSLTSCKNDFNHFKDFDKELKDYKTEVSFKEYTSINTKVKEYMVNFENKDYELNSYMYDGKEKIKNVTDKITENSKIETYASSYLRLDVDNKVALFNENESTTVTEKLLDETSTSTKKESQEYAYQLYDGLVAIVDNKQKVVTKHNFGFEEIVNDFQPYDEMFYKLPLLGDKYYIDDNLYTVVNDSADSPNKKIIQVCFKENEITFLSIDHKEVELENILNAKMVTTYCVYHSLKYKDLTVNPLSTKDFIVRVGD